jgi:hypothetical protein
MVFRRSYGPPTRLVGPTDRSAGLKIGRTHLSGTVVSLIGGDPGVPTSHSTRTRFVSQTGRLHSRINTTVKSLQTSTSMTSLKDRYGEPERGGVNGTQT